MCKTRLGKTGEQKGAAFLQSRGYKIVCRNFRTLSGEIDIVAKKDKEFVFIEVKTRSSLNCGYPEESVNYRKLSRLVKTARYYLLKNKIDTPCRFEVLSVIKGKDGYSFNIIPVEL